MNLDRRSFLRGVLSVAATALVVRPSDLLAIPQIVGDGIHDDGLGLNALFGGSPVDILCDAARIVVGDDGETVELKNGIFRTTQTIRTNRPTVVDGCEFTMDGDDPLVWLQDPEKQFKVPRNSPLFWLSSPAKPFYLIRNHIRFRNRESEVGFLTNEEPHRVGLGSLPLRDNVRAAIAEYEHATQIQSR